MSGFPMHPLTHLFDPHFSPLTLAPPHMPQPFSDPKPFSAPADPSHFFAKGVNRAKTFFKSCFLRQSFFFLPYSP